MKHVPASVSTTIARTVLKSQKNAPAILFVGGVAGAIASTVLACRATLHLEEVVDEAKEKFEIANSKQNPEYTAEKRQQDITLIYVQSAAKIAKLYGPSVVIGVASIAALTKSHNILQQRNAALTAAYAALDQGFKQYRKRVVDELGEDKDREFRYGSEKVKVDEEQKDGSTKKVTKNRVGPNGVSVYARFFDELCQDWKTTPEYNLMFLKAKQNYANDMLHARGHVFLNEIYDELGLERSKAGAVVGWVVSEDGDNFVDFGIFDGDNAKARDFVNGREGAILLDFNVDGVIYDKI